MNRHLSQVLLIRGVTGSKDPPVVISHFLDLYQECKIFAVTE